MSDYFAPTRDMQFVINELVGLEQLTHLPGFEEVTPDLVEAVLEEAGKLANQVLGPLNQSGDKQGARLTDQGVVAADGFGEAYRQYVEGGWNGLGSPTEFDGQGLPELLNTPTHEMWNAANMAFALCPMLTHGAIEALKHHGSEELQRLYLPRMVSGEWTGTMCLTEPQAGSDLSAVRTRAVPEGDHYRLYGQKIYITWGDHDMTANTVHLVLARLPDAPEGVKGISLFLVPKYRLDADGEPGERNDAHCVSIEHKLGINASPTCVMAFGDNDGAVGYLVGEENKGLAHMFTMMNEARLKVGLQGLAIADRAYQQALWYARDRSQGRPYGVKSGDRVAIIHHPDVRRMLLSMRSQVEAMRGLCYQAAFHMDMAEHHGEAQVRKDHQARLDLLIPVIKGWCTELGVEVASTGIQVHGGMGYVEETGAAQHLRDARIAPIYEGTNGIQAIDLVGRKLAGDAGKAMKDLIEDIRATESQLSDLSGEDLAAIRDNLGVGRQALQEATDWCLANLADNPNAVLAQAFNYMMLVGYVTGGWMMARAALLAQGKSGDDFYKAKRVTARFYAEQILPKAEALGRTVKSGGASTLDLDEGLL